MKSVLFICLGVYYATTDNAYPLIISCEAVGMFNIGFDTIPNNHQQFAIGGNICRSPIAEAILQHEVNEKGVASQWSIDSAAIGSWHIGLGPDDRAQKCLKKNGISTSHKVRQIKEEDFKKFDIIFGMDDDNMQDLNRMKPKDSTADLRLLGQHDPQKQLIIEDPYYGEYKDFEQVYTQCERCCKGFLKEESTS